ncbi:protein of unknown function [Burkholderia multivorans]
MGEKKPTDNGWLLELWWRRRESNPRPEAVHDQFYMFSSVV